MFKGFVKFIAKAMAIIYHTILLGIFGACCWALDQFFKFLGYHNSTLTNWIETYDEPVILLSLTVLFIITVFGEYMPKRPNRFEYLPNDAVKIINGQPVCKPENNRDNDIYQ